MASTKISVSLHRICQTGTPLRTAAILLNQLLRRCDGPRSRGTSKYLETPDHCPGNVGSSGNAASENKDHWRKEGNRHTPEVIYKYDRGQRVNDLYLLDLAWF